MKEVKNARRHILPPLPKKILAAGWEKLVARSDTCVQRRQFLLSLADMEPGKKGKRKKKIKLVAQAHNNRLHDYGMHIYTYELVLFLTPSCRGARLCGECDISSLNPVDTSVRAGFGEWSLDYTSAGLLPGELCRLPEHQSPTPGCYCHPQHPCLNHISNEACLQLSQSHLMTLMWGD